jgi:uncharacterized protein
MNNKIDPVIHFEMPAEDTAGLGKFYETAFGWQLQPLGVQAGDFVLAFTGEIDEKTRMPKKRGLINGGFYKKADDNQRIKLTILVDHIKVAIKKVKAAGGKIIGEVQEMPGVGLFVDFEDPEGNLITLNQDFTVKHL